MLDAVRRHAPGQLFEQALHRVEQMLLRAEYLTKIPVEWLARAIRFDLLPVQGDLGEVLRDDPVPAYEFFGGHELAVS